jgi:hypothetical protein
MQAQELKRCAHAISWRIPMSENFATFLRFWTAEHIHSLGHTDPSDLDHIIHSQAEALASAATTAGFYGELVEAAHPYGGVEGYVRSKLNEAGEPR